MFFLNINKLMQYIKNAIINDNYIHLYIVETINNEYKKLNDDAAIKQSEMLQSLYDTIGNNEQIINQKLALLETELLQKVNKLVDSIYSDDDYLQLVKKVDDNEIVNRQTATNLIEVHSKLIDVQTQFKSLKQRKETESIELIVNTSINKTRADIATIMSKVKNEIQTLDIKLDAFIDTISEKIVKSDTKLVKLDTKQKRR
jgi:hypothetical protein